MLLALGLVAATMTAVAVVAHAGIGLPWAVAFTLGAIVSPTDALAATEIASRLGAPRRIVSLIEGESLVNDGTALRSRPTKYTASKPSSTTSMAGSTPAACTQPSTTKARSNSRRSAEATNAG